MGRRVDVDDLTDAEEVAWLIGLVTEYAHPLMGLIRQFGNTIDASDTPTRALGPPPRIGEDTTVILEWLGRASNVDALIEKGVVSRPDDRYTEAW